MKKLFVLSVATIMSYLSLSAQITIAPTAPKQDTSTAVYDSLNNDFNLGRNAHLLKGQCLYFPPSKYISDYLNLYLTYSEPNNKQYGDASDKYFDVLDIIKYERGVERTYLKLRDRQSGQIAYYDMTLDVLQHYIILGNFEKIKNLYVGERYVSRGQKWKLTELVDMNTGGEVNYEAGTRWRCVDVMLDLEDRYSLNRISLVIENEYGGRALVGYNRLNDDDYFFTEKDANEIKKTYGERLYRLIVGCLVEIGMSEDAAILSWGYPSERNRTIVGGRNHEQWVYGDGHYLYFENGKLTSIQN